MLFIYFDSPDITLHSPMSSKVPPFRRFTQQNSVCISYIPRCNPTINPQQLHLFVDIWLGQLFAIHHLGGSGSIRR
jgi:hypothetical protein